MVTVNVCSESY